MTAILDRRQFGLGLAAISLTGAARAAPTYRGPNVILIRFGGGVRRREVLDPQQSFSPFVNTVLRQQGTLFPNMTIDSAERIVTSHAQGTLYILTGRYDRYEDKANQPFRERFEPAVPTLFEYLRAAHPAVADHEALIVNGEDRRDEDFLTYSTDPHYGVRYRSSVLSLNQFKAFVLRQDIAAGKYDGDALTQAQLRLAELSVRETSGPTPALPLESFWREWRAQFGDSGLKNPRGDRLLTALSVRAMEQLRPKLMLVNYQDPDYVHWGNATHYTRAIGVIDQGVEQIVNAAARLPAYRDNTVFVLVPDCGRDDNALLRIPFQHHFNSKSAHEIFALILGPGVPKGAVVDKRVTQAAIAPTIGRLMGFATPSADAAPLAEVWR